MALAKDDSRFVEFQGPPISCVCSAGAELLGPVLLRTHVLWKLTPDQCPGNGQKNRTKKAAEQEAPRTVLSELFGIFTEAMAQPRAAYRAYDSPNQGALFPVGLLDLRLHGVLARFPRQGPKRRSGRRVEQYGRRGPWYRRLRGTPNGAEERGEQDQQHDPHGTLQCRILKQVSHSIAVSAQRQFLARALRIPLRQPTTQTEQPAPAAAANIGNRRILLIDFGPCIASFSYVTRQMPRNANAHHASYRSQRSIVGSCSREGFCRRRRKRANSLASITAPPSAIATRTTRMVLSKESSW